MLVSNSFDLWQRDTFFSAAEEVQESADILESAYRLWIRQKKDGLPSDELDELRREVQTALGTTKWQVMEFLIQLVSKDPYLAEDIDTVLLACDTVINFLLKREHVKVQLDEAVFVHVLKALAYWTEGSSDPTIIMMASSICSLIFDNTSEKILLRYPELDINILHKLSRLIERSLVVGAQANVVCCLGPMFFYSHY